ncbi:MAG: histidine phosphatase family protein [Pirellulales bacterium]
MSAARLKDQIIEALWSVVDRHDAILSATLTGSFVNSDSLEGLSDIDFVLVVDELNATRFQAWQAEFSEALQPVLASDGYRLKINPTLGPLKFNEPDLAVLHLMFYSHAAHVDHVINSPFTCLDWQQSPVSRKQTMAEVYPTFGLQPRHFLSARRSVADYLKDYRASVVSYRELDCHASGYSEIKRCKPMDNRDRHEFAYHVMRFLMLNLIKLTYRETAVTSSLSNMMDRFFNLFPEGEEDARALLLHLAEKKRRIDYATAIEHLDARLEGFVSAFERQFRDAFIHRAVRHVAFRHAPTPLNQGPVRFVGRSNPSICESGWDDDMLKSLRDAADSLGTERRIVSPLARCSESMHLVTGDAQPVAIDERLIEINYGRCEALTVDETRSTFPKLFEAWQQAEDPRFPDGENSADVTERAWQFAASEWLSGKPSSLVCTHNVVLRTLVGESLGVPESQRHLINIPHLAPIEFIASEKFGLFINLSEAVERSLFSRFACTVKQSHEPRVVGKAA